jgi:hypothetical protein
MFPGLSMAADVASAAALSSSANSSQSSSSSSSTKTTVLTFLGADDAVLGKFHCRRDCEVLSIDDLVGVELSRADAEKCLAIAGLAELRDLAFFQCNLPNVRNLEEWDGFDRLNDALLVLLNGDRFTVGQRRLERKKRDKLRRHAAPAAATATAPANNDDGDLPAQLERLKAELDASRAAELQLKVRIRALERQVAGASSAQSAIVPHEIDAAELDFGGGAEKTLLGRGAASRVFAATFRGEPVAVKEIPGRAHRAAVEQELAIAKQVAGHANVVSTFGIVHSDAAVLLVMERLALTLAQALYGDAELGTKPIDVSVPQRLRIAHGVACGLRFLHSQVPPVLHRDLKPDNVLLSADLGTVKLGDFGTSRFLQLNSHMTANVGTVQYSAPEQMTLDTELTTAVDVYAFGVTLWELFAGTRPLSDLAPAQVPLAVCMRKVRPSPDPQSMSEAVLALMKACWSDEARARPTMAAVVRELSQSLARANEAVKLDIESRLLCIVCADEARTIALIPCGHLCVCDDCQPSLKDCPICRAPSTGHLRVFNA